MSGLGYFDEDLHLIPDDHAPSCTPYGHQDLAKPCFESPIQDRAGRRIPEEATLSHGPFAHEIDCASPIDSIGQLLRIAHSSRKSWVSMSWGPNTHSGESKTEATSESPLAPQSWSLHLDYPITITSQHINNDPESDEVSEIQELGTDWSVETQHLEEKDSSASSSWSSSCSTFEESEPSFNDGDLIQIHASLTKYGVPRWQHEYILNKFAQKAVQFLKRGMYYQFAMLNNSINKLQLADDY